MMDLLLNPLASQDHIPLGITWSAGWLLKFVAALLYPVPLDIVRSTCHFGSGRGLQPLPNSVPNSVEHL